MLRVCIASIQNVERSLLLLVVFGYRYATAISVLFSSAYSSMLQAVANKHSLVSRRLHAIYTSDLKASTQCTKSAAKARRIIGMVRRNFKRLDKN